jgi:hypothetical protein
MPDPHESNEAAFVRSALGQSAAPWDQREAARLSVLQIPDKFHGRAKALLRADINQQWARWFVESLADPVRYIGKPYVYVFSDVYVVIAKTFTEFTDPERKQLASEIATAVWSMSESQSRTLQRSCYDRDTRRTLLDLAGSPPRCWICGAPFTTGAIDGFLSSNKSAIDLPAFIDILKPRGMKHRDLRIEVDHVCPFSRGGPDGDNLRLACGWCNRHKGPFTTIYDVDGRSQLAVFAGFGFSTLPRPLWTARILGMKRRCEHEGGCERSSDNAEVTVCIANKAGTPNPINLRVTCYEHDPYRAVRLQPRSAVRRLWGITEQ